MPRKACSSILFSGTGISVRVAIFCRSGCMPSLDTTSPKNGIDVHLKWHFSLFSFKFTSWHHLSTLYTALSWSVPSLSYPITRMSSAMPNTSGMSLKISSILCWNMSPAGTALNVNTYICICQIDRQMWLSMMTTYLILGCGIPDLHRWWTYIVHC